MDSYDFVNFVTWLQDPNRKPANVAFTAGVVRDAATAVEQSGVLARLAVLWKVEEMIPKQFFNLIVSPLRDGGFNVSLYNWDAEVEERECEGKTLLDAFVALVDGKEGG